MKANDVCYFVTQTYEQTSFRGQNPELLNGSFIFSLATNVRRNKSASLCEDTFLKHSKHSALELTTNLKEASDFAA